MQILLNHQQSHPENCCLSNISLSPWLHFWHFILAMQNCPIHRFCSVGDQNSLAYPLSLRGHVGCYFYLPLIMTPQKRQRYSCNNVKILRMEYKLLGFSGEVVDIQKYAFILCHASTYPAQCPVIPSGDLIIPNVKKVKFLDNKQSMYSDL